MPSCPGFAPPFPFWLVGLFPACLGHRVPRWSLRSDGPHPAHPIPAARWHGKARSLRSDGFRSLLHVLTSPCTMVVSPERAVPRRSRSIVAAGSGKVSAHLAACGGMASGSFFPAPRVTSAALRARRCPPPWIHRRNAGWRGRVPPRRGRLAETARRPSSSPRESLVAS